jgi:anti-sigma B factor antagonist/stage II sporulation protein AA (anti-sigma F factor antagonist)
VTPSRFADAVVLSPAGRIDHASAEPFKDALLSNLGQAGKDPIVLDLGGVEYIASAGLRALMVAAKQAKTQGRSVVIAALQPVVREVFEISRFTLVFKVFPTVREALASVSAAAAAAFDARAR